MKKVYIYIYILHVVQIRLPGVIVDKRKAGGQEVNIVAVYGSGVLRHT